MAESTKTSQAFLGASGSEYLVDEGADRVRSARQDLSVEDDALVFVELGKRVSVSFEDAIRRQARSTAALPKTFVRQVSTIVDVAYDEEQLAGFIATSLSDGMTLTRFLESAQDDRLARIQVAQNLCVAVGSVLTLGRGLGRLSPDRILVRGTTCQVFIEVDYPAALSSGELTQHLRQASTLPDVACDLALHVYALLLKHSSSDLGKTLWRSRLSSLFSGPAPAAVRRSILDANPLSLGERMRERFGGAYHTPRLKGVPRSVEPLLRAVLLEGSSMSASELAIALGEQLERRQSRRRGAFERLVERFRGFRSQGLGGQMVARLERRPWGLRGSGQLSTFWLTTLWASLALGVCSMMDGFAPLDVLLGGVLGLDAAGQEAGVLWQYPVAAVAGSVAYNLFAARRHYFKGYTAASYGWSVAAGVAFMTLTRAVFLVLGGGAL